VRVSSDVIVAASEASTLSNVQCDQN